MMKFLLFPLLALGFALAATADTDADVRELVREKRKLETEIVKVFGRSGLAEDPAYKKASEAAMQTSREFTARRRELPALKPYFEASDVAQKKMIAAQRQGDKEAGKAAMSEFTRARIELEKVAAAIPELEESKKKAQAANTASETLRRELLAGTEEGKKLVERLKQLDVRIKSMSESLTE